MKTNFENIGGSYSQQGDYLFPNLTLSDENQSQIGVWVSDIEKGSDLLQSKPHSTIAMPQFY